ncbi:tetratricopeptide repeat protein [Actinoplanes bogorensis]|uniref:Tetratricopeptide repeat protein n=1 Tax=Paractinoplanes bogorensis TaxID=1610840 RepID=A0ABS5YIZ2_9ACTN|nr:tetratricopeptide repeat protein [Actinoplanes bogorensis]MBU2663447.1 tetratricopeptide repeat protein [Actinoplanes bogorensis]
MAEPDSLLDILRRKQRAGFVGRHGHLEFFRDNLRLPALDDHKRFVISIHGDGGVGKTFLLQQLRRIAREEGASDAYTDEHVYGVPETMSVLAGQLGKPFNDFLSKYEDFEKRREQMAQDPQAPMTAWSKVTRTAVKIGLHASKALPGAGPIVDLVDADAAAEATDQVRVYLSGKFSDSRDVRLLLNPVAELSPLFLQGLRKAAAQLPVALFFDTYEQTGPLLDGWLLDILRGRFGDPPTALTLTVAGRHPLVAGGWSEFLSAIATLPIVPFSEAESRQLLASKGVTDEPVVRTVLTLSGGLPLLVATLAEGRPTDPGDVGDPSGTAVERFLKWEHDPGRRDAVLAGALSRQIDADVLAVLAQPSTLEWLQTLPFVKARAGRYEYHDVVRAPMLRIQKAQSAQNWRSAHHRLADAHETWRTQVRADPDWTDAEWLRHRLEETYHRLCADPAGRLPDALAIGVDAAIAGLTTARRWAEMIRQAGRDSGHDRLQQRGERLVATLDEQQKDCTEMLTELIGDQSLSPESRVNALVERGRLHYYADRDEQSIVDFTEAIRLDPARGKAYLGRGQTSRWLGRFDEALADLNRVIELDPESGLAVAGRGEIYQAMERYEEALADFDRAIELDPASGLIVAGRGETYQEMKRYDDALADFNRAMELAPKSTWAVIGRGHTYRLLVRFEEALADFDRAVELDPTSSWAVASRGQIHREMGRYSEALADLTRAIELAPRYAWALAHRGETHRLLERPADALTDLDRAVELDPRNAWIIASRGQIHRETGRYDDALADLTRALELTPDYAWARANRGETYRLLDQHEQALADLDRAIELDPNYEWAIASRGQVHREKERYSEAIADLTRAIELDPRYAWAIGSRGQTYREMGRLDDALTDLSQAIEIDPALPWTFGERGETYRFTQRYDEALVDLTRAIDLNPKYSWAIVTRGQTYRAMGRFAEALADFDRAIDLNPAYDWALSGRGETHRLMGRNEQALADIDRAIELDSSEAWHFASRWRLLRDEADLARARELDTTRNWADEGTYQSPDAP